MKNYKKIMVMSDVLKFDDGICYNTEWLYEIFKYIFGAYADVKVLSLNKENPAEFYNAFYEMIGIKRGDWFALTHKENNEKTLKLVQEKFKDCFVIAFELQPIMQKAFDALKIPYVKMMNHPIRYLDDIFFGITSGEKSIFEKIKTYQADTNLWKLKAAILKAETARKDFCKQIKIKPNSCVFFAQTNVDCSLLDGDRVVSFFDYLDRFMELYDQYDHLYYKVHPCESNQQVISLIKTLPKASILYPNDISAYDLLGSDRVQKYVSISSGALYEAKYFGKEVEYFLHQPFMFVNDYKSEKEYDYKNTFIPVYKHYWQPSFWADILKDYIAITKPVPKDVDEPFHNTFRKIINMNWGYPDYSSVVINHEIPFVRTEIRHLWETLNRMKGGEKQKTKLYKFCHLYWLRGKK